MLFKKFSRITIAVTVLAYFLCATPAFAADALDEVINFLIADREAERKQQAGVDEKVALVNKQNPAAQLFVKGFQTQGFKQFEENGLFELQTTFYSENNGPSYTIRLLKRLQRASLKSSVTEIDSFNRMFQRSDVKQAANVSGYSAIFLDSTGKSSKGMLVMVDKETFVSIRSNTLTDNSSLLTFANALGVEKLLETISA